VNARGEVFSATAVEDNLPGFIGPEGSAATMLERYRELNGRLAEIKRHPTELTLSPRAAWQVRLDNGVLIDLGRDQPKVPLAERIDRFIAHYAAAQDKTGAFAAADMRYPNGFVLRPGQPGKGFKQS
jgi:cell division protein FtsQ